MCLSPISLRTPKRKISLYGGIPYLISVNCGKCAECKKQIQSEWNFRSYYECKDTFDNNGYVYFDTLTYRNEDLPHISDYTKLIEKGSILDYPCFNTEHYRLFFVNLRRQLEYHGYDVKNNLKYFLCSEYGTSDTGTHRPHYHILLFMKDGSIDPLELSRYVNKCWQKGRTDGIDYHPKEYVMNHVFGPKYNSDEAHLLSICNYVAKYVTKNSSFEDAINNRLNVVYNKLYGEDWSDDRRCEDRFKKLRKEMLQFHRQSHHFGENFWKYNDMEKVFETGMISMPDKNNIIKHIPMPMYYERKIFYELLKDADGRSYWKLTEDGVMYKLEHKRKSLDLMKKKFEEWIMNMNNKYYGPQLGEDGYDSKKDIECWYREHKDRFIELLGERDLMEFVIYLLCYKGRVKSREMVEREKNGIYRVDDLGQFIYRQYEVEQEFGVQQVYNYSHYTWRKVFGKVFLTDKNLGDKFEGMHSDLNNWRIWSGMFEDTYGFVPSLVDNTYSHSKSKMLFGNLMHTDFFESMYVISDSVDIRFKDFDKMYSIYCDSLKYCNKRKQAVHDEKERLTLLFKDKGLYNNYRPMHFNHFS